MSGPAIHYLVGKSLPTALLGQLGPNMTAFNVGTMGPDFLFFNANDMPAPVGDLLKLYLDVDNFIEDFRTTLIAMVPEPLIELKEQLDNAIEGTIEHSSILTEIEQTHSDFQKLIDGLLGSVEHAIVEHITNAVNVFDILAHPIQDGTPKSEWWWFDTLHYRRTGEFAEALLRKTINNPDSPEHAYALGYLTHVASDVVGHPYVNLISGGPYRIHPQRHKVVENFNDVWAFDTFGFGDFAYSELHQQFKFGNGRSNRLPQSICDLISSTVEDVYGDDYGSRLASTHIQRSFGLWYKWFQTTNSNSDVPPPQPYSITGEIQEVWDQFLENVSDIGDSISNANSWGGGGFLGFLAALGAAILSPLLLGAAAIDFVGGLFTTVPTSVIRFFLSLAYQAVYDAYSKYRLGVALNGLAFPLRQHLSNSIIMHVNDPGLSDALGHSMPHSYPRLKFSMPGYESESHLLYPQSAVEQVATTGAPDSYRTARPNYYMTGDIIYRRAIIEKIRQLSESELPSFHNTMRRESLGNAVRLTEELYAECEAERSIPLFNLDSDRGIGYPCWKTNNDEPITGNDVNLEFTQE